MTMNVYEVAVRFMRRVQMKEYEPAEAEVTFKAQLDEGENHILAANNLMQDAKVAVIETGFKSTKGKTETAKTVEAPAKTEETVAAPVADTGEKKPRGRPPKAKPVVSDDFDAGETKAAPAATDEFDSAPATKSDEPAPQVDVDEFGEPVTKPEAPAAKVEEPISVKELQAWVAAHIQAKRIDADTVKATYAKFGYGRSADTTDEDRPKIKAAIEKLLS
jgi:hypothetical protein